MSVFTPAALAREWECSERHIRNLIAAGQLRAFYVGNKLLRIPEDAIAEFGDRPPPEPEPRTGIIYFICGGEGVKIGFSTNHNIRLAALQSASPVPLTLTAQIAGTLQDERALHKRFKDYRLHGEWFRFDGALKKFVEGLA